MECRKLAMTHKFGIMLHDIAVLKLLGRNFALQLVDNFLLFQYNNIWKRKETSKCSRARGGAADEHTVCTHRHN